MTNRTEFKRLQEEQFEKVIKDYPEMRDLIASLNEQFSKTSQMFERGIKVQENANIVIRDVKREPGGINLPLTVRHGLKGKPIGVNVIVAYDISEGKDNPQQSDKSVTVDWKPNGDDIKIIGFPGVDDGRTYSIRLQILGE